MWFSRPGDGRRFTGHYAGRDSSAIVDIMMPRMDGITMMMKVRDKGYDFRLLCFLPNQREVDKIMD